MIVKPSIVLLWIVGVCFVPICALPAILPSGERYIWLVAAGLLALGFSDLALSWHNLSGLIAILPAQIRMVLNEEHAFSVELKREAGANTTPSHVRLALALPPEISGVRDDVLLNAPQPRHSTYVEMSATGLERGAFQVEAAYLGCTSNWRLWQMRRKVPVHSSVLVQPDLRQIWRATAKLLATKSMGGQRVVARNGRGREFAQLREYVPSDDFGDIDWKATARRRTPIVREYQVERTQDIYVCIDFSRLSGQRVSGRAGIAVKPLDEYVRTAVMLNCAVRETGDHFGLITFSNRLASFVKAAAPTSLDQVLRKTLYPLTTEMVSPAFDEVCAAIRTRVKRRALLLFLTNLSEPHLAESFTAAALLLAPQHLIIATCLADSQARPLFSESEMKETAAIYEALSGHLLWKRLAQLRLQLASSAIRMHIAAPGQLGAIATREYLRVKEQQLL